MIIFKFKEVVDRLGKSISDIARETGLNRNTVTALYHGKVDGIKFETLEKLCATYHLSIADLINQESETVVSRPPSRFYKQEGDIVPFTVWWAFFIANNLPKEYFDFGYGALSIYHKGETGEVYFDFDGMQRLAEASYRRYGNQKEYSVLWSVYCAIVSRLESLYQSTDREAVSRMSNGELVRFLEDMERAYHAFWGISIFIDSFDAGFDSEEINRIAKKHGITKEDASVLSSPSEHTFNAERHIAFLELAKKYLRKKPATLKDIQCDPAVLIYQKNFEWYKTNYSFVHHVSFQEIYDELHAALSTPEKITEDLERLRSAPTQHKRKVSGILRSYGLKKNPLWFFQSLTYWREHRKKTNLMGIQVLYALLEEAEKRTGIAMKYLKFMLPEEYECVLRGTITREILRSRYEKGILLKIVNENDYKMFEGREANSLRDELESILRKDVTSHDDVLTGTVASQGYARGVARIILGREDFGKFKKGEVLVTGMTRPDFLPVMKMAIGIVTNEGGLTSHAAIVSRELGVPCIIGTKRATQAIKTGDIIEVRAHHGTVRIVQRANA